MGEMLQQPEGEVKHYPYETRCRKCGILYDRRHSISLRFIKFTNKKNDDLARDFFNRRLSGGFIETCYSDCGGKTVHDLISFKISDSE